MIEGLAIAAVCGAVGWAFMIHDKVTTMQAVIDKLDTLITLMLEDRLAQSQNGGHTPQPGNRGGGDQRGVGPAVRRGDHIWDGRNTYGGE